MEQSKTTKISVRLDLQEKKFLEEKAQKERMDLSQYIRYKVLQSEEKHYLQSTKPLSKHEKFIMRLIITGYLKLSSLAKKELPKEELNAVLGDALAYYRLLGIEKIEGEWDTTSITQEDTIE